MCHNFIIFIKLTIYRFNLRTFLTHHLKIILHFKLFMLNLEFILSTFYSVFSILIINYLFIYLIKIIHLASLTISSILKYV